MALNISSPSQSFHDHPFSNPISRSSVLQISSSFQPWNTKVVRTSLKFVSPRTAFTPHAHSPLTTQTPSQESLNPTPDSPKPQSVQNPGRNTSSRNSVWVNPNSPRASRLRQLSTEGRYSSLVKLSESLNVCNSTEEDVSKVASILGENPLEQDVVIVLNNMENPENTILALRHFQNKTSLKRETILYNVTLKVLKKSRKWDRAEWLLGEMIQRGVKPDNVTFSTIISCARLCSLPSKAIEWFEKMPECGCLPDDITFSAMIDAYGRAGNVELALSLYDKARKERWRLDLVTFSTLIRVYGSSGNFDGALNVYEEMKALGVKPNVVIYNTILDAMGRAGRPWQVKTIYKEMNDHGILPNWNTYAALLRGYCRARYPDDALSVYREMKEKGMELTVILYNTLLAMCADIGCVDEAVQIFEEMEKSETCQPDSWSFSSLVTIFSCSGQVVEAERALNKMLAAGFEPNIFILTSIIQCYGKAKRTDDVVRTFNWLLKLGITPDDRFCGCLLNVMTQTPKEELSKLVSCVEKAKPDLGSAVKQLVDEESEAGLLKQMTRELLGNISQEVKKAYCNCLIDLCVNLDLMEKGCELLDLGLELDIYNTIHSKSATQWSLHVRSLSLGAALTALHVWINDLSKSLENGEELPPLLGIHTGHGKHKYSETGLATVFVSHLKELQAPFHEAPDKVGWFLTTKDAAKSWLELRKTDELATA
ncbi:pentatricopeptide repeat-containing protein At4g16390, chloroplastic-like [Aristolochia californica]|uniref:pentatricopeptide repeat-containing protein At4g16390, chloroplastic-like n=1 Tax=Aristolochia californica TaxID=171875 RepID=UPI0035DB5AB1